jgi:hypothetical protein
MAKISDETSSLICQASSKVLFASNDVSGALYAMHYYGREMDDYSVSHSLIKARRAAEDMLGAIQLAEQSWLNDKAAADAMEAA